MSADLLDDGSVPDAGDEPAADTATSSLETWLAEQLEHTDGLIEIRVCPNDRDPEAKVPRLFHRDLQKLVAFARKHDIPGRGVYGGMLTRDRVGGGKVANVLEATMAWMDNDHTPKDEVVTALRGCEKPPSQINDSGRGIHAYWRFTEPLGPEDHADLLLVLEDLRRIFAGDTAVVDLARVMRLPGTTNTKHGDARPVTVLHLSAAEYDLVEIKEWASGQRALLDATNPFTAAAGDMEGRERLTIEDMRHGNIHNVQLAVSGRMVSDGKTNDEIVDVLLPATKRVASDKIEIWDWKKEERAIRRMSDEARGKGWAPQWPDPEDLDEGEEPQPYPVDALPDIARDAVLEYQRYGMQPIAMVGTSALAAMGGAAQGLVDIRREGALSGPVSLCAITIAESGERKTACDRALDAAGERWAKAKREDIERARRTTLSAKDSWESTKRRLLDKIRRFKQAKAPAKAKPDDPPPVTLEALEKELKEHYQNRPGVAPTPIPRFENQTVQSVEKVMIYSWPSVCWASNEGAAVVAGHSFQDEGLHATLAFLNARWDGAPLDRGRSQEEYIRVDGRRLSVTLMVQEKVFTKFTEAGGGAARGLGALSRTLLCWPPSTMGTRLRDENAPEAALPCLAAFARRGERLYGMALPMPFDMAAYAPKRPDPGEREIVDQLELTPVELCLSPAARRQWIRYSNECERELLPEGEAADVRDVAAKSAENACRIAAIFHVWQHGPNGEINDKDTWKPGAKGEVSEEDMLRGIELARWYLYEARRILCDGVPHPAAANAQLLAEWIRAREGGPPTLQEAAQFAPYRLRKKLARDAAIKLLIGKYWLRLEKRLLTTVLVLNPKLEWGE